MRYKEPYQSFGRYFGQLLLGNNDLDDTIALFEKVTFGEFLDFKEKFMKTLKF